MMFNKKPKQLSFRQLLYCVGFVVLAVFANGCNNSAFSYLGQTRPPQNSVLRYVSGPEPASLDPQISDGQSEARIYLAMFEGLVEYDPKTMQPIPALAQSWEISPSADELILHLRPNAKWSDGAPLTAKDFVYSFRRGFAPETASRTANLGYYIKYAAAFNGKKVFVQKNNEFLLAKDFTESDTDPKNHQSTISFGAETEFYKRIKSSTKLTLNGDQKERAAEIEKNPKLAAAIAGAEFIPVEGKDIGVEAIDDNTLRITLEQPAPFFLGLLAHPFFRAVPRQAIEKYGKMWTKPGNLIASGAFALAEHRPYDILKVEKNLFYWDAANVKLAGIEFYPLEEQTTMLNLYKAGYVDATYNHTVPVAWIEEIKQYQAEYLNFPEAGNTFYSFNVQKPPMNSVKVREAFNLAVDKVALAKFRKITQPLENFVPDGIFPDYDQARAKVSEELRQESGTSPEDWKNRNKFNSERARKLLAEAGFTVVQSGNNFICANFPADKIAVNYATAESNRQIAEFLQAQWKQNLGITVPLKNMEFKTFQTYKNKLEYNGLVQGGWGADYMDPVAFLGLHYGAQNTGATGWQDERYDRLLNEANKTADSGKRYELLARAEFYMLEQQIVIPLQIPATNWIKKPYVKGMYPNPGTLHAWKYVYIELDQNKWDERVYNILKID